MIISLPPMNRSPFGRSAFEKPVVDVLLRVIGEVDDDVPAEDHVEVARIGVRQQIVPAEADSPLEVLGHLVGASGFLDEILLRDGRGDRANFGRQVTLAFARPPEDRHVDVCGDDAVRALRVELVEDHGERVRFAADRAAGAPDLQLLPFSHQLREPGLLADRGSGPAGAQNSLTLMVSVSRTSPSSLRIGERSPFRRRATNRCRVASSRSPGGASSVVLCTGQGARRSPVRGPCGRRATAGLPGRISFIARALRRAELPRGRRRFFRVGVGSRSGCVPSRHAASRKRRTSPRPGR